MRRHTLIGYRNPVRAVRAYLAGYDVQIDEESFERMAQLRGDADPEILRDGFEVAGFDDLQRLCEIAQMVVCVNGDRIVAMTYGEWLERNSPTTRAEGAAKLREHYRAEGRAAKKDGVPIADCPYTAAPPDRWGVYAGVEWLRGWYE